MHAGAKTSRETRAMHHGFERSVLPSLGLSDSQSYSPLLLAFVYRDPLQNGASTLYSHDLRYLCHVVRGDKGHSRHFLLRVFSLSSLSDRMSTRGYMKERISHITLSQYNRCCPCETTIISLIGFVPQLKIIR